ncbi:MAG: amidohydrolase family protein [Victivallales bacterium]|nr:amidohydrolase family protein [Victivallales bacterium]
MKKLDMHHHLVEELAYVDTLLQVMDENEIEKTALIGLGALFRGLFVKGLPNNRTADNRAVAEAVRSHPDRFFALGFIRLGVDGSEMVDELAGMGFKGLKFTIPKRRYDDKAYFPVYERASSLRLPCLFHTGIIGLPVPRPEEGISSFDMDCIHLEAIAQAFPDLTIIIAHLGVQNFLTALTLIRIFPNVFADLSGTTPGWRANISPEEWGKLLWFENASEKIIFGSDVHACEINENVSIYNQIADFAGWDDKQKENMFYHNAAKIMGFEQECGMEYIAGRDNFP